jgi:hypothetical protein
MAAGRNRKRSRRVGRSADPFVAQTSAPAGIETLPGNRARGLEIRA